MTTEELVAPGKKIVAFALPGAFTPTSSVRHVPGFLANIETIKGKGVDTVACISVNDAFVVDAWGKDQTGVADLAGISKPRETRGAETWSRSATRCPTPHFA